MNRTLLWFFLGLSACDPANLGSTSNDDSGNDAPLERSDVEDLPPGDAAGTEFAGDYIIIDFARDACTCTEGDPEDFDCSEVGVASRSIGVEQDDGRMGLVPVIDGQRAAEFWLSGGIHADGSFTIGGVTPVVEAGEIVGQTFAQARGSIVEQELSFDLRTRVRYLPDSGDSVDCDVRMSFRATRDETSTDSGCALDGDCPSDRPHCIEGACLAGVQGDRCRSSFDCSGDSLACIENRCHPRGDVGDPCTLSTECLPGLWCSIDQVCKPT